MHRALPALPLAITLFACSSDEAVRDPLPDAPEIVVAALNEGHTGDLGGIAGADELCASQAAVAGRQETFRALLSSARFDLVDLVSPELGSAVPLVNTFGEQLLATWADIYGAEALWASSAAIYAFDGTEVGEGAEVKPPWFEARAWHGSNTAGEQRPELTCRDWQSNATSDSGASSALPSRLLLQQEEQSCNRTLAVLCVGGLELPTFGTCADPGTPCNADDPCAIEPRCGGDRICRPRRMLNCADGLTCTTDRCDGDGGCDREVRDGWCLIEAACYEAGATDPSGCKVCDPLRRAYSWTALQQVCQIDGTCYQPGDKDESGCRVCDPEQSPNSWTPLDRPLCKIDGFCYEGGAEHPDGCARCNPSVSVVAWTPTGEGCLIDGRCQATGAKEASHCSACNPDRSRIAWTPIERPLCKIEGQCFEQGERNPGFCAECDPAQSAIAWTVKGNDCLIDGSCYPPGARDNDGCQQCDPATSKTAWSPLVEPHCKIGLRCYQAREKHPEGCAECDPAADPAGWTAKGNDCYIDNQCFTAGTFDASGCNRCDPESSLIEWTPLAEKCQIGERCYQPGELLAGGCARCDPSTAEEEWTPTGSGCLIARACHAEGAVHPAGCAECSPGDSTTAWTAIDGCRRIVLATLDHAYNGDLGGLAAADTLCAERAVAAGLPGDWRAFLSSSTRNVVDLVAGADASAVPVVNLRGEQLYASYGAIFSSTVWASPHLLYAFDGKAVTTGSGAVPNWYDGSGWTGSLTDGTVRANHTCLDWTSAQPADLGADGELDQRQLLKVEAHPCSRTLAVICLQLPPA
jgi:hypothetical protein